MTKKKDRVRLLDGRKGTDSQAMGLTTSSSSSSSPLSAGTAPGGGSGASSLTSPVSFTDVMPSSCGAAGGGSASSSSTTNRHYAVHDVVARKLPVHASACGMCYAVQWEGYSAPRETTWEYRNNLVHAQAATPRVANTLVASIDRGHKRRVNYEVAEWGKEMGLCHRNEHNSLNNEKQEKKTGGLQNGLPCDHPWTYANNGVQSTLLDPVAKRWYTREPNGTTTTPLGSSSGAPPTPFSVLEDAIPSLIAVPSSSLNAAPLLGVALLVKEGTIDEQGIKDGGDEPTEDCEEGGGNNTSLMMDGADSSTTTTTTMNNATLSSNAVYEWMPLGESGSFSNPAQLRHPHTIAESTLAPSVTHSTSVRGLMQDHERRTASILKHISRDDLSRYAERSGLYTSEEATELCCNQVFGHSAADMKRLMFTSDKTNNWSMWGSSGMGALVTARRAEPLLYPATTTTTTETTSTTYRIKIVSLVPCVEKLEWARFGNSFTAPLPMTNNSTLHAANYSSAASLLTSHMDEVLSAEFMNFRWAAHVDKDDKLLSEVVSDLDERQLFNAMTKKCMDMAAADETAMRKATTASSSLQLDGGAGAAVDEPPRQVRVLRLLGRKAPRGGEDTTPLPSTNTKGPIVEPTPPTISRSKAPTSAAQAQMPSPDDTTPSASNKASTPHMRPFWDRMGLEETFTDPLSSNTDVLFYAPPSEDLFRMPLSVLRVNFEQELIDFLLERSSLLF